MAAPITRVTLVDVGSPIISDHSNDVGPYDMRINGRNVPVLCIDLADESKIGQQWSAAIDNLAGNLSATYHPNARIEYAEEAYLFTLIIKPGADRLDLQHAAWAITDLSYQPNAAAEKFVLQAEQNASTVNLAGFEIISEMPGFKGPREQEFLAAAAPEPFLTNFVAGLIAVGLILLGRKRG
ncbi:MAG TPA: hypothetical protein VHZ55_17630 [Bryobacteraceae bacterium]|nr:hypothetical protein [Bryobacteraceae bacterium]